MKYKFTLTDNSVAVVDTTPGGELKLFDRGNPLYNEVFSAIEAFNNKNEKLAEEIMDKVFNVELKASLQSYEGFRVENDIVFVDDVDLPVYLGNRLRAFANEGKDYKPILNFWHKVKLNGNHNSVHQLFQFLENNHCPLTPDGDFIGYKAVRQDWMDKHTGKVSNKVGESPSMRRTDVDEDNSQECSYGFHVGSFDYALGFAMGNDRLIEVKVNPEHVVSVAAGENFAKLRTCKYLVVKEIPREGTTPTTELYDDPNYIEDDEECEDCGEFLDNCHCDDIELEDDEVDENDNVRYTGKSVSGGTKWFPDEEETLEKHYWNNLKVTEIAEKLGRTVDSVRKKLKRMGL